MNLLTFTQIEDYSKEIAFLPLSGGINSAGVLAFLGEILPPEYQPKTIYVYYAHLEEHSPGTLRFVRDCLSYAKRKFQKVIFGASRASVNEYFIKNKMIPHPTISPCSRELKMNPMDSFSFYCTARFIGYVKGELRRVKRAAPFVDGKGFKYPILEFTEDDCFELVKKTIGWYPAIYDIRWQQIHADLGYCSQRDVGKRVFLHNNCLPCKNMQLKQLRTVGLFFPVYAKRAEETAKKNTRCILGA